MRPGGRDEISVYCSVRVLHMQCSRIASWRRAVFATSRVSWRRAVFAASCIHHHGEGQCSRPAVLPFSTTSRATCPPASRAPDQQSPRPARRPTGQASRAGAPGQQSHRPTGQQSPRPAEPQVRPAHARPAEPQTSRDTGHTPSVTGHMPQVRSRTLTFTIMEKGSVRVLRYVEKGSVRVLHHGEGQCSR